MSKLYPVHLLSIASIGHRFSRLCTSLRLFVECLFNLTFCRGADHFLHEESTTVTLFHIFSICSWVHKQLSNKGSRKMGTIRYIFFMGATKVYMVLRNMRFGIWPYANVERENIPNVQHTERRRTAVRGFCNLPQIISEPTHELSSESTRPQRPRRQKYTWNICGWSQKNCWEFWNLDSCTFFGFAFFFGHRENNSRLEHEALLVRRQTTRIWLSKWYHNLWGRFFNIFEASSLLLLLWRGVSPRTIPSTAFFIRFMFSWKEYVPSLQDPPVSCAPLDNTTWHTFIEVFHTVCVRG